MPELTPTQVRRISGLLAGGRTAIGLTALAMPEVWLRSLGMHEDEVGNLSKLAVRVFGVRELVLGVSVLERLRFGLPETTLLRLNALCDALDAGVVLSALGGSGRKGRIWMSFPVAAGAAATWLRLARAVAD